MFVSPFDPVQSFVPKHFFQIIVLSSFSNPVRSNAISMIVSYNFMTLNIYSDKNKLFNVEKFTPFNIVFLEIERDLLKVRKALAINKLIPKP